MSVKGCMQVRRGIRHETYWKLNTIFIAIAIFLYVTLRPEKTLSANEDRFYLITADQTLETLDCVKLGLKGVIFSNRVRIKSKQNKMVNITCPIIRFEQNARLSVLSSLNMKVTERIEGIIQIDATARPLRRTATLPPPTNSQAAGNGTNGKPGRNSRSIDSCETNFENNNAAMKMKGGIGQDGITGSQGSNGINGLDGVPGNSVTMTVAGFIPESAIKISSRGSDGFDGSPGGDGQHGGGGGQGGKGSDGRAAIICRASDPGGIGGKGGSGGNGGDGGKGGTGGNGGKGGRVEILLDERLAPPAHFITIDNRGGLGGLGGKKGDAGKGGIGGKGGRGGRGGKGFLFWENGQNGADGKAGADGKEGAAGVAGEKGRAGDWGSILAGPSEAKL